MHSNEGQPRRRTPTPAPAPRGGRGGSYVTGSTATPGGSGQHYPTPAPPAVAPAPVGAAPSAAPTSSGFVRQQISTAHSLVHLVPPQTASLIPSALGTSLHTGVPVMQVLTSLNGGKVSISAPKAPPKPDYGSAIQKLAASAGQIAGSLTPRGTVGRPTGMSPRGADSLRQQGYSEAEIQDANRSIAREQQQRQEVRAQHQAVISERTQRGFAQKQMPGTGTYAPGLQLLAAGQPQGGGPFAQAVSGAAGGVTGGMTRTVKAPTRRRQPSYDAHPGVPPGVQIRDLKTLAVVGSPFFPANKKAPAGAGAVRGVGPGGRVMENMATLALHPGSLGVDASKQLDNLDTLGQLSARAMRSHPQQTRDVLAAFKGKGQIPPTQLFGHSMLPKRQATLAAPKAIQTLALKQGTAPQRQSLQKLLSGLTPRQQVKLAVTEAKTGKGARAVMAQLGLDGGGQKKGKRSFYVNPFKHSQTATQTRTDQGVDYNGVGPIGAIGRAKILNVSTALGQGWEGGGFVMYQLLDGPKKGMGVFVQEGITPKVQPGQIVQPGERVADFIPGFHSGIEIGKLDPNTLQPTAQERPGLLGDTGSQGGHYSPVGARFHKFLSKLGGATPLPAPVGQLTGTEAALDPNYSGGFEAAGRGKPIPVRGGAGGGGTRAKPLNVSKVPDIGIARQVAPTVQKYAKKYNIPFAVMMGQEQQESNFDPSAFSNAAAFGISQFIPSTAASYGVKPGTSPAAIKSQIRGQAQLLRDGIKSTGSLEGSLNAYYGSSAPFTDALGTGSYASKVMQRAKAFEAAGGQVSPGPLGAIPGSTAPSTGTTAPVVSTVASAAGVPAPVAKQAVTQARQQNKPAPAPLVQLTPPNVTGVPFPQALAALFGGSLPSGVGGGSTGPATGMSTPELATLLAAISSSASSAGSSPLAALLGRRRTYAR